jgi:hypothetical protein
MLRFQILLPKNQNNIQRTGFAAALIACVSLVFLHNPIDGYHIDYQDNIVNEHLKPGCTDEDVSDVNRFIVISNIGPKGANEMYQKQEPIPEDYKKWDSYKKLMWQYEFGQRAAEIRKRCIDVETIENFTTLPLSEWKSLNPFIFWLGSVIHLLASLLTVLAVAAIWLFVFQSKKDGINL